MISISILLIELRILKEKYFISNVEERSYVSEMLHNLFTAAQMERCRGEIQTCSAHLCKLVLLILEEMTCLASFSSEIK